MNKGDNTLVITNAGGTEMYIDQVIETTGLGAAYLAGLATGYWKDKKDIIKNSTVERKFENKMDSEKVQKYIKGWHRAVKCALVYADEE
jgi:glycerol kinase